MNPSPPDAALSGVRVIDLSTVIFGPYAAQMLAEYGADVIKVETPDGDSTRKTGPAAEEGMASLFLGSNRGKRSVVLDLKTAAGRETLIELAKTADVFLHNVRPQKLEKLGITPAVLLAANPRLVYASLYGFGSDGPYAGMPAYDDVIQSLSGAADLIERQYGRPGYLPTIVADKTCAHMAVHAIIAALFQRQRTGRGQVIEIPMFESMVSFLMIEHFYARHLVGGQIGETPARSDLGYPRTLAPWRRPFQTLDGYVCLMPYTDQDWRRFFDICGLEEAARDPRFADIRERTRHIDEIYNLAGEQMRKRTTADWVELCRSEDIPCAPVNRLEDLESDPHLRAVGFFQEKAARNGIMYRFPRSPVRMSESKVELTLPPRLGEHTQEVLSELRAADSGAERGG
jgi:crotonobetainyl-CoA:carnitine CoA-transferase CaiB-like acyl-CoA transferase